MKPIATWLTTIAATLSLLGTLVAQTGSDSNLLGSVKDSSGAVVAGATVTITNLDTGLKQTTVTQNDGNFEIPGLPIGFYSVSVSMAGFKTWNLDRAELAVGDRKRVSPVLHPGAVTEQVVVMDTAPLMQTDDPTLGTVVQQREIRDLPLNGRNPIELASLVPGVRLGGSDRNGPERMTTIFSGGSREDATQFQLNGHVSNAANDEGGTAIPNSDTVSQFIVETSSFSAAHGRNPVQVAIVTKSGTNSYHGTVYEFVRNDAFDARYSFSDPTDRKPQLRQNQFGFTVGGPIIKNKTFFFGSYEGMRIRTSRVYNSLTYQPAFLPSNNPSGGADFSNLGGPVGNVNHIDITDPSTGQPFPGNIIPANRINPAAQFFFSDLLVPNSTTTSGNLQFLNLFRAVAPETNSTNEYTARVDHQITPRQRIFGNWVMIRNPFVFQGYKPGVTDVQSVNQQNIGVNYAYGITNSILLTVGLGYMNSFNRFTSPQVGIDNLTEQAGIQGFSTPGREGSTGLPSVELDGPYTGFGAPWGRPGKLWEETKDANVALNVIRGRHTINLGYDYIDQSTFGAHASDATRGYFGFNGQYSGDAFADFLLGLPSFTYRNYPLHEFGVKHLPYHSLYAEDYLKAAHNLTLQLGLRWDFWPGQTYLNGNGSTFDPQLGVAVAGETSDGTVDLTAQPAAAAVAAATAGLWIPASQAHYPRGLLLSRGYFSPRLGMTWQPFGKTDLVVRVAYGTFAGAFRGNIRGSSIVGLPFWNEQFKSLDTSNTTTWEDIWGGTNNNFGSPSVQAPAYNLKPMKTDEWNVSIQKSLSFRSALTVSYVGSVSRDLVVLNDLAAAMPGPGLPRRYPAFGGVTLFENNSRAWYNALQAKWERRFTDGLSFLGSYSWAKNLGDNVPGVIYNVPTPYAPSGYNRGRSDLDKRHILTTNVVYELPFGRGKQLLSQDSVLSAIVGGWEISGIYHFVSGDPVSIFAPFATLGNGYNTRANLIGDPHLAHPTKDQWYNPTAFGVPPDFQFGNSPIGVVTGPSGQTMDLALLRNFRVAEGKEFQFRWEAFNALNKVNLGNPYQFANQLPVTGQIFSAGPARILQFGLKFLF